MPDARTLVPVAGENCAGQTKDPDIVPLASLKRDDEKAWELIEGWEKEGKVKADMKEFLEKQDMKEKKGLKHGEIEFKSLSGHRCKYIIAPDDMEDPDEILVHMFSKDPSVKHGWKLTPPNLSIYGCGSKGSYKTWSKHIGAAAKGEWNSKDDDALSKTFALRMQDIASGICQAVVECGGWFDFGTAGRGGMSEVLAAGLKVHWLTKSHLSGHKTDTVVFGVRSLKNTAFKKELEESAVDINDPASSSAAGRLQYPSVGKFLWDTNLPSDGNEPSHATKENDDDDDDNEDDEDGNKTKSERDVFKKVWEKFLQQCLTHIVFCQNSHLQQRLKLYLNSMGTRAVVFAGGSERLIHAGVDGKILHEAARGTPIICLRYTGGAVDKLSDAIERRRNQEDHPEQSQRKVRVLDREEGKGEEKEDEGYALPENVPQHAFTILRAPRDSVEKVIDKLTLVLSTVHDDEMREVGFLNAEESRLKDSWHLRALFKFNSETFRIRARLFYYMVATVSLATTLLALTKSSLDYDPNEEPPWPLTKIAYFQDEDHRKLVSDVLQISMAVLPLLSGFLLTLMSRFNPLAKWATLERAQKDLLTQIYSYRTRVGDYVPRKVATTNVIEHIDEYVQARNLRNKRISSVSSSIRKESSSAALETAISGEQPETARSGVQENVPALEKTHFNIKSSKTLQANTRRACFARNIEKIHTNVINSELKLDSLKPLPPGYAKKLREQRKDRSKTRQEKRSALLSTREGSETVALLAKPDGKAEDVAADDGFSLVTAEDYVKFRMEAQMELLEMRAPNLGWKLHACQTLVFFLTACTTLFAVLGLNEWIPLLVMLLTTITGTVEFEQLETRLRNVNACLLALNNTYTWWQSLSMVEKRQPQFKEYLVSITEDTMDCEVSAWMKGATEARKPNVGNDNDVEDTEKKDKKDR